MGTGVLRLGSNNNLKLLLVRGGEFDGEILESLPGVLSDISGTNALEEIAFKLDEDMISILPAPLWKPMDDALHKLAGNAKLWRIKFIVDVDALKYRNGDYQDGNNSYERAYRHLTQLLPQLASSGLLRIYTPDSPPE